MNILDTIRLKISLALFPGTEERALTKKEFDSLLGNIKHSYEAVELFKRYMGLFNIPVLESVQIDRGDWHFYIVKIPDKTFIITFKRYFLYAFDKMFNLHTGSEGTGLNSKLLEYATQNNITESIIIRPNGEMYLLNIRSLLDYSNEHGTIRKEKDSYEFHCPVSILKKILVITEDNEINQQIKKTMGGL